MDYYKGKNKHHGGKGKKFGGKHGSHEEQNGRRGGHRNHHNRGEKGGHMKWCIAGGILIFTAICATFLGVFRKFISTFRSYHLMKETHASVADLSLAERNRTFNQMQEQNSCRARRAMRSQMRQAMQSN